ncbi:MAG: hypothetical protein ABW076_00960 [Candidatus Thiodiazotropha sp.]
MLLNPAIMALVLVSIVDTLMVLMASVFAMQVLLYWDIDSGSERQLRLERRTYLISTLLIWTFSFELLSLLLFVYNAESLSGQFVGAMCATGVLNLNPWGWPTLFLKIGVFFFAALWLTLNFIDNRGYDYPLIRYKYALLLLALPLVVAELFVQGQFFLGMDPQVITSCCGTLFSADAEGVAAEVSGLAPDRALILLTLSAVLVIGSGLWVLLRGRTGWLLSLCGTLAFVVALVSIVSFLALYIYEHPHHHCPFCILKSGYDYIGYLLYLPLFLGAALALSAGVVTPWRNLPSLRSTVIRLAPRLGGLALLFFLVFYLLSVFVVWRSNLTMEGVWW